MSQQLQLIFLLWQFYPNSPQCFLTWYCDNVELAEGGFDLLYHLTYNYSDCPVG